jgi:hypothetical protein
MSFPPTTSPGRRVLGAAVGLAAALTFASCSDDDGDSPAPDNSQMIPNSEVPMTQPGVTPGG